MSLKNTARRGVFGLAFAAALSASPILAAETCPNRGDLDPAYCDANHDLVADPPTDPKKFRDPKTLVFAFSPLEDPALYEKIFQPFVEHLSQCVGRKTIFFQVQSNSAEVEAMRSGRLHIAAFSSGPTTFAVNIAGAVPFAIFGTDKGPAGFTLAMIVKKDSPYQKLADLKGKKIAHVSPSSVSGNMAPRVIFPKLGLIPEKDYTVLYSGKHDQSIMGVRSGDYDAAPVASNVLELMTSKGAVGKDDFRIIYNSELFPTDSFTYAHDLEPGLVDKIKTCFFNFKIPPEMVKGVSGDRFVPIAYQRDWKLVREITQESGQSIGRAGYEAAKNKESQPKK